MSEVNPLTAEELARVRDDCEEDGGVYLPIEVARRFLATIDDRDEAIRVLAEQIAARQANWLDPDVGNLERLNQAEIAVAANTTAAAAIEAARSK